MFNTFEMAIGNAKCVVGFDKRSYPLPIPVTVMDVSDEKYSDIFYEITGNIIQKADFDEVIRKKIDDELLFLS